MRRLLLLAALCAAAMADMRSDVEFARPGGVSLTLDAWVPPGSGPFPAVLVVHGGAFVRGDKQTYVKPLFPILTGAGFAWFTINYRLAPQHKFPAAVEDVEAAVRWVKQNARNYKVDPRRIALVGESAGGHLVAFAGVTSAPKLGVKAVVPIYAPFDLLGRAREAGKPSEGVMAFLGLGPELTPETLAALDKASPITHVKPGLPPFLLIHGTRDAQVPYAQSVRMLQKLKDAGVPCELYTVEGGGHGMGSWENLPDQGWRQRLPEWLKDKLR